MASGFVVSDYRSIQHNLWETKELKINSSYSLSLKATIEKLCSKRCKTFEKYFEEIKKGVTRIRVNSNARK